MTLKGIKESCKHSPLFWSKYMMKQKNHESFNKTNRSHKTSKLKPEHAKILLPGGSWPLDVNEVM